MAAKSISIQEGGQPNTSDGENEGDRNAISEVKVNESQADRSGSKLDSPPSDESRNINRGYLKSDSSPSDESKNTTTTSTSTNTTNRGDFGARRPSQDVSEHFMFETKYVLLNFMSLVPPDLYKDHIIISPESATSGLSTSDNFTKSHSSFSKSQSFDASISHRNPKLRLIGKLKSYQREILSPASDDNHGAYRYKQASEDNLSYRYKQNTSSLAGHGYIREVSSDISHGSPGSTDHTKSSSAHSVHPESPLCSSPHKSPRGVYRMYSDISSSGDLSYMDDADDEYEDLSNASSIFSSRGVPHSDPFLDLRRTAHSHRMATLDSQSELEQDEVPRAIPETSEKESDALAVLGSGESLDVVDGRVEEPGNQGNSWDTDSVGSAQARADRTKLKLEIPCQPLQLDDILVSLQTELNSGLSELETEYEDAVKSARDELRHSRAATPAGLLTPQTEAARVLARIGDEVKDQYGTQITTAINRLVLHKLRDLTYQQFYELSQSIIDTNLPGWRQVALLMVYEQNVLWNAVKHGNKQVGCLVDYCSQLVADVAADFIIKEGGWSAVMNFDPSQSSDSVSSLDSPALLEYFTSHNVTQVLSGHDLDQSGHSESQPQNLDTNNASSANNQETVRGEGNNSNTNNLVLNTSGDAARFGSSLEVGMGMVGGEIKDLRLLPGSTLHPLEGRSTYRPSFGFDFREHSPHLSTISSVGASIGYFEGPAMTDVDQTSEDVFNDTNSTGANNINEQTHDLNKNDDKPEHSGLSRETSGNADSEDRVVAEDKVHKEDNEGEKNNDNDDNSGKTVRPGLGGYQKDSVYVKQDTPKLNNPSENNETVSQLNNPSEKNEAESQVNNPSEKNEAESQQDDGDHGDDTKHDQDDTDGGTDGEKVGDVQGRYDGGGANEIDDLSVVGQIRRTGFKVMAVTLAVLALGVGVRIAVLNR